MAVSALALPLPAGSSAQAPPNPPPSPAPPFEQVCFEDFDLEHNTLSLEGLQKLLRRVPEQRCQFFEARSGRGLVGCFAGTCRLSATWRDDSVLRLAVTRTEELSFHFFRGEEGITLRYFSYKDGGWAAYKTTRRGKRPWPESFALWAVDAGRHARTLDGTVEIRCQDGYLVLSRGDLVLLCVPFDGSPEEVYFDGEAAVHGLAMLRSQPAPLPDAAYEPSTVLRIERPAEQPWLSDLPDGAQLKRLADGRVELSAEVAAFRRFKPIGREAFASVALPADGLVEYIVEIEDATGATGVFVADRHGKPWCEVVFSADDESDRVVFTRSPVTPDARISAPFHVRQPMPDAGRHQWLRIVAGAGVVQHFISGDGVHFSPISTSPVPIAGEPAQIGLCCRGTPVRRSIKLRSLEVRRLDGLESLVPAEILRRVRLPERPVNLGQWRGWVSESQPADVPRDLWRKACTIRALSGGLPTGVCQPLLYELLDQCLAEPGPVDEKLRLLHQASLLMRFDDEVDAWPRLAAWYEQLGDELISRGDPRPFSTIHAAMLRLPIWTSHVPLPRRLLWHELIMAVQDERWNDLADSTRRLKYWTTPTRQPRELAWREWSDWYADVLHLLDWAAAEASLHVPGAGGDAAGEVSMTAEGRHPLVEPFNKEGFNILGEFRTAADAGALREACQVIVSSTGRHWQGLLPADRDRQLLVSLETIVGQAMEETPALGQTMRQQFEPLAQLRLQQALDEADPEAVQAITRQFCGTEAAVTGEGWLADRDFSQGRFVEAADRYRQALRGASAGQREKLLPRLRLAAAMIGRDVGPPAEGDVTIGSLQFSAGQFEQIARDARETARAGDAAVDDPTASTAESFPPGDYRLQPWAQFETDNRARGAVVVDARSLSAKISGGRMIVGDARQLAAFELASGELLWQETLPVAPSPAWTLGTIRPAVHKDRIYVRRLTEQGAELGVFDLATGRLLLSNASAGSLIGDLLPIGDGLFVMTTRTSLQWQTALELAEFDPESGHLRQQMPLANFRDRWDGAMPGRMVLADEQLVATVGGAVLCCDLSGQVHWIRRQRWVPPPDLVSAATRWNRQIPRRPLVVDGRIYATQPGVWAVECIDQHTGRLVWRRGLPELTCLVGCTADRLIVETSTELLALEPATGEPLWRHALDRPVDGHARLVSEGLVLVQLDVQDKSSVQPLLTWLDPQTGQTVRQTRLPLSDPVRPRLGPLLLHANRGWLLLGSQNDRRTWRICELEAMGE